MHDSYTETQKKITKESIFTALMKLLERKQFHEITITQITNLAGVSRMAFYRNYSIKEDIITIYLDELFEEFYNKFLSLGPTSKYDNLCNFFSFFKERKHFIEILMKSGLIYIFYQKLCVYLINYFKGIEDKNKPEYGTYLAQFEAGGLYNVLLEWISNNTKDSVETMAKLINGFTH
jgi:AcrR family transcriptional regulator